MDWDRVPEPVKRCCETLWAAGETACPVGGCVRDSLLGRTPGDWDVATSARPETVQALFARTVPTGLRHGTVTVLLEGMSLEVTAFRREEGYADGRRPDRVVFGVGLTEDLARRDFTINAMALLPDGTVADPFGGRADLDARLVRCVGDPERRFREDALRMLRAVRFAAQLDFAIEGGTAAALRREAAGLDRVSGERVRAELEKTLLSPRPELCALPVELGMLVRFGAAARPVDLTGLAELPATQADRWRGFCQRTGLDITALPVERRLRRAVLAEPSPTPALTGGELYAMGFRGTAIRTALDRLKSHISEYPEDNTKEKLREVLKKGGL